MSPTFQKSGERGHVGRGNFDPEYDDWGWIASSGRVVRAPASHTTIAMSLGYGATRAFDDGYIRFMVALDGDAGFELFDTPKARSLIIQYLRTLPPIKGKVYIDFRDPRRNTDKIRSVEFDDIETAILKLPHHR